MTVSKAQMDATARYEAKTYDKVLVRMPKGKKAEIEKAIADKGGSVNSFINEAINEKLDKQEGL